MSSNTQSLELFKTESDGLNVEYEILSIHDRNDENLAKIDDRIREISDKISYLDAEIEKLTNHADGIDYTVAVASGILSGLVDSFFVGETNWEKEFSKTCENFNRMIVEKAGYADQYSKLDDSSPEKKDILQKAINKLEQKFPLPSDNAWKTPGGGNSVSSPRRHHIEDFCHHPTPIGFLACIISVLFKTAIFVDKNGNWHFRWANTDKKDMIWLWGCIIATAFLQWLVYLAEKKYEEEQYKEMPKPLRILLRSLAAAPVAIELIIIFKNWSGHLCSDIAGSKSSAGGGMGIPGLLLASLKEILSIPPLNMVPKLHKLLDFYFIKGFDARAETTILRIAGKQMLPVLLNEIIVRGFYFIRRLIEETKLNGKNWDEYNWEKILPVNNRTIVRMLTIAHGTFVAVDLADAAIRSALKNGTPQNPKFWTDFVIRVNFVGIGRFSIALFFDAKMGIQRYIKVTKRMDLNSKMLNFYNAKIYYKQQNMWEAAEKSENATQDLSRIAQNAINFFSVSLSGMKTDLNQIHGYIPGIKAHNPGLCEELATIMED